MRNTLLPTNYMITFAGIFVVSVIIWVYFQGVQTVLFIGQMNLYHFFGACFIYLLSHILRMLRLVMLSFDERPVSWRLVFVHAMTAFPSSFLPYKIGEVLRFSGFFHVLVKPHKAVAVWFVERLGDVVTIILFTVSLFAFNIGMNDNMRNTFVVFIFLGILMMLGVVSVNHFFAYLHHYLITYTSSNRGLLLLKVVHELRYIITSARKTLEGRFLAILLLSWLIWICELLAISLFVNQLVDDTTIPTLFYFGLVSGISQNLNTDGIYGFGLYQASALITLPVIIYLLYIGGRNIFAQNR
ncbi:MAG: lysylphosphatidylglycerol synthase domain-containing protein [Roseiflexaceae bacterium]